MLFNLQISRVFWVIAAIPIITMSLYSFAADSNNNSSETEDKTEVSDGKTPKDTVKAFVMYGERFLFDCVNYLDRKNIGLYRDSLESYGSVSAELIEQINLYLKIQNMDDFQVISLIDSLFEQERIPYPLINQINLYVANRPVPEPIDMSIHEPYPCNHFYSEWNTSMPFTYSDVWSKEEDTTIYIALNGNELLQDYVPPFKGVLTSPFGWREGKNHNGVDIDLEVWDTVVTAFPGVVRIAKTYGGWGRVVVVRHYNGLETLYAHLHRIKVKSGQKVNAGDLVGLGGSSGKSTGSHLHFECRFKGKPINPMGFISFKNHDLIADTIQVKTTNYGFAAFPKGAQFHVVQKGDFLHKIAQQYGTTTNKLCEMNGIKKNKILVVGEKIRII